MFRIFLLLFTMTLISCGPSAEEKAALIKAQEVLIREAKGQKQEILNQINSLTAEIAVQNDRLSEIQEFQFLRTSEEREQQIRDQVLYINKIKDQINELNNKKNSIENQISSLEIGLTKIMDN